MTISPERMDIVQTQWLRFTESFAEVADALRVFDDLVERYCESHRHYHNLEHLGEVLKVAGRLASHSEDSVALTLAVWFHDAVYDPRRDDNEAKSADLAMDSLQRFRLSDATREQISSLILATRQHVATTANERVLLDADLAILAAAEARYDRYAAAIRREFGHVSDADFRVGRRAVLEQFLAREHIFHTPVMAVEGEAAARRNLSREAANLA